MSDLYEDERYSDSSLAFDYPDDKDDPDDDDLEFEIDDKYADEDASDFDTIDDSFSLIESSVQGKKISKFVKDLDAGDTGMGLQSSETEILP